MFPFDAPKTRQVELPEKLQNALAYLIGIVDQAEAGDPLTDGQKLIIKMAESLDDLETLRSDLSPTKGD